jgi:hypothetical protein
VAYLAYDMYAGTGLTFSRTRLVGTAIYIHQPHFDLFITLFELQSSTLPAAVVRGERVVNFDNADAANSKLLLVRVSTEQNISRLKQQILAYRE